MRRLKQKNRSATDGHGRPKTGRLQPCCLFMGYCDCECDREAVLRDCDRFLAKLARRHHQRLGMPFEDLWQELRVDVWTHAEQYKPHRGTITTWAGWRCRAVVSAILFANTRSNWARMVTGVDSTELDQIPEFLDSDDDCESESEP